MPRTGPALALVLALVAAPAATGATYYVRTDGGSPERCTGLADSAAPASGTGVACAWDHPFRALPPAGTPRLAPGDTLVIGPGAYMMGFGAPGADACDENGTWECHAPPVPSGLSPAQPTRIVGAGWSSGCPSRPELWGTERADRVLDLTDSSNVEIACLTVTDRSSCVEFHSGALTCQRDSYPHGPWAAIGLYAEDSSNVRLADLDIHGLAHGGVLAGRLTDWTVERVRIAGNGSVGWDGDIDGDDGNTGTMTFRRFTVEWNGCGETYPGLQPTGCWAQSAGGYGDGFGTGETGGTWVFEDSAFLHNTSDGLDLLYARRLGSSITIRRTKAEGNAGNPIKTTGPALIENTIAIGNCAFFDGKPFTFNVDNCRALGNSISLNLRAGDLVRIVNSTVGGQGDCLVTGECDAPCNGTERVRMRNNIFVGDEEFLSAGDRSCLMYQEQFPQGDTLWDADYHLVTGVKDDACPGTHKLCAGVPGLVSTSLAGFDAHLLSTSPAIGFASKADAPSADFDNRMRDAAPDLGAYEYGTSGCTAAATTLCIDDAAGDRRFKVEVDWSTVQGGGQGGKGQAVATAPIGFARGGIFWFFEATNPEMLVKVLNGCGVNGKYWVFASAGTNVGLTVAVTDTKNGSVRTYVNPDLTAAPPVQDVLAFPCP